MSALRRLVFFGTPEFAVPTLDALAAAGRAPVLVVSQPSRAAGRGRSERPPPVARWAEGRGVALLQVERVRRPEFLAQLRGHDPDLAVVVAFGQIFPQRLLDIPRQGCVNLHASLLPRHRGAAPVAAAIAAGERQTGVTTILMEAGLDSGPILLQRETMIGCEETTGELGSRLARIGADLVVETVAGLERGELEPTPQDESVATHAPRLEKEDGRVDWSLPATVIFNRLRAYTPWPGVFASFRDEPLKLIWARPLATSAEGVCGTYLGFEGDLLAVRCGEGSVLGLERVQRSGRRTVSAREFANGVRLEAGERFS